MASTGERVASLGFALLVCLSLIGGGVAPSPVGTVAGQSADTEQCSTWDSLLYDLTTVGNINTDDENPCSAEYQRQQLADEWNESDANETRTQIHSQAGQLGASNKQFLTAVGNSLLESETIAFSKGEAAAVEVLANGGTVSEAQAAANESIEEYYAVKQYNLLDRWNVNAETVHTLSDRANETTGVERDFISPASETSFNGYDLYDGTEYNDPTYVVGTDERSVQIVNGSTVLVTELNTTSSVGVTEETPSWFGNRIDEDESQNIEEHMNRTAAWSIKVNANHVQGGHVIRVKPTTELSSKTPIDYREFWSTWTEVESESEATKQEAAVYINQSLGPAVDNGELNATDYISPSTLAQEYATSYLNSTSYVDATALAAYSGMSTPDLNNTASMTVTHDGTTYQGLLLSQNAPDAGWESGENYDPALISGVQLFAVAGDNGRIVELDGQFTIEEISGPSGDPISTADTVEVTYETANTSEDYAELQQQIRTLNEQIEEQKAQATSGGTDGGSSSGLLDQLAAALGVSVGAAVAVAVVGGLIAARVFAP